MSQPGADRRRTVLHPRRNALELQINPHELILIGENSVNLPLRTELTSQKLRTGGRNSMITIRDACVVLLVAACLAITALVTQELRARADGTSDVRKENQNRVAVFTTPPGFVVERVAGPPLVERPMMAGFDELGRLFVCDS